MREAFPPMAVLAPSFISQRLPASLSLGTHPSPLNRSRNPKRMAVKITILKACLVPEKAQIKRNSFAEKKEFDTDEHRCQKPLAELGEKRGERKKGGERSKGGREGEGVRERERKDRETLLNIAIVS